MGDVSGRFWAKLPDGSRDALVSGLSQSELQSVLLDVTRERAANVKPARLLQRWKQDRFVWPSTADPRQLVKTQQRLWELLPEKFAGVQLSPLAPLGTCSAVATINQHQIVSTIRGTEVASDPTNELAIEAAVRRRAGEERVHLAACQRVVRAQPFDTPGFAAHFELFVLVSSARDTGSFRTEAEMLIDHLDFWHAVLGEKAELRFTAFKESGLRDRIDDTVRPALGVPFTEDAERTKSANYYAGTALGIGVAGNEIGDGGFTTWTADLLGDAKERCLTSCVSTEFLTAIEA
ncbi:hypothetical protein JOF29_004768 [Kribbella aluminosa]|uniref:Uncharacterized protein n=1 Tax=Kribbella aluminosa TaxID=416017 RepID=A0ABS4UPT2_9ACTN|nr:hypothetical protein [Kribbella aluminosa]MBP2353658.1 hypothetical protein [Kribbella aluminosa]